MRMFAIILVSALVAGCAASPKKAIVAPSERDRAFAAEIEAIVAKAQGTPGQEMANMIMQKEDWRHKYFLMLKGEKPATEAQLLKAHKIVGELARTARKGPDWPRPPLCRVPRAPESPKIDGKLDDEVWKRAATYKGVFLFGETAKQDSPATTWKMLWDAEHLYFAFDCADTDVQAPKMKRDDRVYKYDCVEMFILPDFRKGLYWEIVISPSGSIFDALHCKLRNKWGAYGRPGETMKGLRIGYQVQGTVDKSDDTDQGYSVEVAVPRKELPEHSLAPLAEGQKLHFMLVRLDKTEKSFKCYSYQPLLNWGHNIWNHAEMELVK